jgi:hypothetical protein
MIRRLNINKDIFVRNYLPVHKRKSTRLNWLYTLAGVFGSLWNAFGVWRDEAIIKANVNGETIALEWYLNYIVGGTGIYIETAGASGVAVGLQATEPTIYMNAGIESSEPTTFYKVGLIGETDDFGTKTFVVYVPTGYMSEINIIKSIVNTYRAAGKSFKIKSY